MEKSQKPRAYFYIRTVGFKKFTENLGGEHIYTREEIFKNLSFDEAKRLTELLMAEMYREVVEEVPSIQGFTVEIRLVPEPEEFDSYVAEVPPEVQNNAKTKVEKVYVS